EMSAVLAGMPAPLACDLTAVAWPCRVAQEVGGPLLAGIQKMDARDARRTARSGDPRRPPAGSRRARKAEKRAARKAAKRATSPDPQRRNGSLVPIPNGGSGAGEDARPLPNGGNGEMDPGDWLRR